MSKRLIVLALVIGLVAALTGPADAKKKRKKKKAPKPYVSEQVMIHTGHPGFHSASEGSLVSVTAQEFFNSCAIPESNGFDAAVFEVPSNYQNRAATVEAKGADGPAGWDLDIYLYDANCELTGAWNAAGPEGGQSDEIGTMLDGTAFVLVHNYLGVETNAHIELTPLKPTKLY